MKQNKLFLGLATMFAAAFAFTSCSSEELQSQSTQQDRTIRLVSTLEKGGTRSTEDPQNGTLLSTSSNLAIWAINTTADLDEALENGDNEQYSVNNIGNLTPKTADNTMTWPDGATLDFYAYAPYNSEYSYNAANSFSVQADQSTEANYLASDLVLARATNKTYDPDNAVALQFNHMLSKVNITIKEDANSNVNLEGAVVSITNTLPTTTFNPSTGELGAASGSATEITAATIAADLDEGNAESSATACAVVVPQPIAAGTEFIKIVTSDSKTLIGKLSAATTLEGSNSYSMTISVGKITEPVTIVDIELGSATLVQWTDNTIGLTAYGVGDYVLKDGTFIKAADYAANSANVAAIIFSTSVSETDGNAGYNAYAMGLTRRTGRTFPDLDSYKSQVLTSAVTGYYAGYSDLDGRTKTAQMLAHEFYTSGLDDTEKSSFVANMSEYTPAFTEAAKNATTGTVSDWFLPSFGQMRQILSEFGGVTFVVSGTEDPSDTNTGHSINGTALNSWGSGTPFYTSAENALTTLVNNLNSHVSGMFAEGNICFATSTENGGSGHINKFWFIGTSNTDKTYWMGKGMQRGSTVSGGNNYNVIPVVAVKLPAVAQQ